ncbi:MAG: hypothetical protein ABEJ89_02175 [Haloarculaceae archaeon]
MDYRLPPTIGLVAAVAYLVVLGAPYVVAPVSQVGAYYGSGAVSALVPALFAVVALIVMAAGRQERTAPDFAAGVALVVGLFTVLLSALWALTVRPDVITFGSLAVYHRWVLVAVSLVLPAAAVLYARTLGLF